MSPPTLVYLINKLDYGGAEMGMVRLLSGLEPETFDVHAILLKGANPDVVAELPDHVRLVNYDWPRHPSSSDLAHLARTISEADVMVCSLFPSIVIGSVLGRLGDVPEIYVWRHNTTKLTRRRRALNRLAFLLADGIFTDSAATSRQVEEWGVDPSRIHKLPLAGVELDDFPQVGHHPSESPIRIGTVGRLIEQKGYPELLACATRRPGYMFHVVGDGPLLDSLNVPENVHIDRRVPQSEMKELWESFDIYFQPSRHEGLCITAIEAMACGLPVVASAVDGLTESVIHEETGYLVPVGDVDSYCARLDQLASDPDQRARFGASGRERVRTEYSRERLVGAFLEAVREPAENSQQAHRHAVE